MAGNKLLEPLGGIPAIVHTVAALHGHPLIERIHLIAAGRDREAMGALFADRRRWPKLAPLIPGGAERQESVFQAVRALEADPPGCVLVHDGARPFCSSLLIDRILAALESHAAVVPLLPLHDTIRHVADATSHVVDRSRLFRSQTPQGFHFSLLRDSHRQAARAGMVGTDDAQLVEQQGALLHFVEGEPRNIKLTTPLDFQLGSWLLANAEWGR